MKKKIFAVIILIVSIAGTNTLIAKDNNNHHVLGSTEVQDNVVIIEKEKTTLLSDSTQLANGEYVIRYNDTPPMFQAGDVILGQTGFGYLRKVVSSEVSGNTVILQTKQATFENLYKNAQITIDMPYSDSEK